MRYYLLGVTLLLGAAVTSCQTYKSTKHVGFHQPGFTIQKVNKYGGRFFIVTSYMSRHHSLEVTQQAKWDRKLKRDLSTRQKRLGRYSHAAAVISAACADYTAYGLKNLRIKRPVSMTRIGVDRMVAARVGTRNGIDHKKYAKGMDYIFRRKMRRGDILLVIAYSNYRFRFFKGRGMMWYRIQFKARALKKTSSRKLQRITTVSGTGSGTDYIEGRYRGPLSGYVNKYRRIHPFRNAVDWATLKVWEAMNGK